jgi:integral membrane sensor domain MASE1
MGKPWFRVKSYGFGAGLPCSWEGWAVLLGYLALVIAIATLGSRYSISHPLAYFAAIIVPTIAVVWISWRKSDGPWKWRSGEE